MLGVLTDDGLASLRMAATLALKPNGTYSTTSLFGKSSQAFDPRTLQASLKLSF